MYTNLSNIISWKFIVYLRGTSNETIEMIEAKQRERERAGKRKSGVKPFISTGLKERCAIFNKKNHIAEQAKTNTNTNSWDFVVYFICIKDCRKVKR